MGYYSEPFDKKGRHYVKCSNGSPKLKLQVGSKNPKSPTTLTAKLTIGHIKGNTLVLLE